MTDALINAMGSPVMFRRFDELGITIAWNGSATFNVYTDDGRTTDCFTASWDDDHYGPPDDAPWGQVQEWVTGHMDDYVNGLE